MYSHVNDDLKHLSDWFKSKKKAVNKRKKNYILFRAKNAVNADIEKVEITKFFGIYIDTYLNWETHCKIIERQVAVGLYALNAVKHLLPSIHLASIYFALILSYLTFGCILSGSNYEKYLHKIKVSKKKAIHIILLCHAKYKSPTASLFKLKISM